jgi:integrase
MRLSKIFGFATASGYIAEHQPDPARKKVFEHLVARPPEAKHHKPMPSAELPAFMAELIAEGSPDARSLALCILTNVRTNEARDVDWSEIDGNVWTIPGGLDGRMKEGEMHRVWLSPAALALLGKRKKAGRVFNIPNDALIEKLNELRPGKDYTVHGMRTTFKGDWALRASYPAELREMALGHAVGEEFTKGYNLPASELYTILIPMRQAWTDFCMAGS